MQLHSGCPQATSFGAPCPPALSTYQQPVLGSRQLCFGSLLRTIGANASVSSVASIGKFHQQQFRSAFASLAISNAVHGGRAVVLSAQRAEQRALQLAQRRGCAAKAPGTSPASKPSAVWRLTFPTSPSAAAAASKVRRRSVPRNSHAQWPLALHNFTQLRAVLHGKSSTQPFFLSRAAVVQPGGRLQQPAGPRAGSAAQRALAAPRSQGLHCCSSGDGRPRLPAYIQDGRCLSQPH